MAEDFDDALAEKRAEWASYMRAYTRRNKDAINAERRARRAENREVTLAREKAWRTANREKVLEYKKRDREKRPEDYARWKRDWEKRNIDKVKARKKADYRENKDEINARLKKFRRENPEHYRKQRLDQSQRRRARLAKLPMEDIRIDVLYERDKGVCGICGREVEQKDMSVDHIVPVSFGGAHTYDNVQLAHINCNKARGNRDLSETREVINAFDVPVKG